MSRCPKGEIRYPRKTGVCIKKDQVPQKTRKIKSVKSPKNKLFRCKKGSRIFPPKSKNCVTNEKYEDMEIEWERLRKLKQIKRCKKGTRKYMFANCEPTDEPLSYSPSRLSTPIKAIFNKQDAVTVVNSPKSIKSNNSIKSSNSIKSNKSIKSNNSIKSSNSNKTLKSQKTPVFPEKQVSQNMWNEICGITQKVRDKINSEK